MRLRMTHAKIAMAHVTECEAGYTGLAIAIIRQAVVDYRKAYRYLRKHSEDCFEYRQMIYMIGSCERFFASCWCAALGSTDGMYILQRIQKEEEQRDKKKSKRGKKAPA